MNGNTCFATADCALCVNKELSIVKREITVLNSLLRLQTLGKCVGNVWGESRERVGM